MSNIEPVSASRFTLGECVLWDERTENVWWTDIHARQLWQYAPARGRERCWALPQRLGCFALTHEDGILLLGLEQGLARFDSRSGELVHLCTVEADLPTTRLNDGRCDRAGNFVFGTLNEGGQDAIAGWYRYSPDGTLLKLDLPGCRISNSLCFSPAGDTLYFADSTEKRIMCGDYDAASAKVSNVRLFHDLASRYALPPDPDGSIVDADGGVWNAEWGAGNITRYHADGRLDRVFAVPASQPTCAAFGGPALDTLYVTTAQAGLDEAALREDAEAGRVFAMRGLPYRGLPESRFG